MSTASGATGAEVGAAGDVAQGTSRAVWRRRVHGVERSVFLSQLAIVAAMLCLAGAVVLVEPATVDLPTFVVGYGLLGVVTAAAFLVQWSRLPKATLLVVPLADIFVIALISFHSNTVGFSLFYTLPVIWLATHFRMLGVALSVILPTALQIAHVVASPSTPATDVTRVVAVPIVLGFVAVTVHLTRQRVEAQRSLMRRQATALQHAVTQSRRSADYLDSTFEAMRFGIVSFAEDGQPTLINSAHRAMRMRVDGTVDGIGFRDVYAADGFTRVADDERPVPRALREGDVGETVVWVGVPGGARLALAVSSRRTVGADGRPDGVVLLTRDVTAERLAVQARDDLVAMVSHELRTPLTAIIGYLDLALDGDIDVSTRSMLTTASVNAERLIALTDDFRAAASGIDAAASLDRRRSSVRHVVEASVASLSPMAARHGVPVRVDADPVVLAYVDEFRLRQVTDNLVSNAIKYCRHGGDVHVVARQGPDETTISVTNSSDGLTDEELARIFDRFYRTDEARHSAVDGSGLGLAISSDIIAQHGGRLTASSVAGESVTLRVSLPLPREGHD